MTAMWAMLFAAAKKGTIETVRAAPSLILGLTFVFSPILSIRAWPPKTVRVSRKGFARGLLSLRSG